ncbi:ABC transporter permease [Cesiribacter sp. SM1]|uniref:ABC transporter permease n=1 Tax=Cesiribacter sp. SM1 TaxID=2861196 RepID=UPI001CD25193|nr:ABC transporter permease [Cesiribacter sp. SM1]
MLKNYVKIAFRSLWRSKAFSAINIFGLAIGIACCLVIMLFVEHELSYDRFHEKADRIVRVVFRGSVQGEQMNEAHVMPPVAQALVQDYPEVEQATRLRPMGTPKILYGDKVFSKSSFAFADSNFFKVFTLPLLKGDPATALGQPNALVISQSTARNYFGDEDPIGRVLQLKDWKEQFTISGVMADIPANSHFRFDMLASMATFPDARNPSWMVSEFYTYLLLPEGYDYKQLEAKLPQVVEKYMGPQLQQSMGISLAQFREAGNDLGLFLQPLSAIYLHSDLLTSLEPGGDIRYVYIFAAVAAFMLLIACINFMNLSTAGASKRAREVGVRKVLGSGKGQLVGQFLTESVLLSLLALLLGLLMVELALPVFNELSGKSLGLRLMERPLLIPGLLLFGLFVGVLAGSYPAFFLSSFKPVSVLKGSASSAAGAPGKGSWSLRSGLVVFQFCISIVLIIGTTVVYQQLQYIQNKKLGYEKDQVLVLPETWLLGGQAEVFRQQLLQDPRVQYVSTSGYLPAGPSYNNNFMVYPDDDVSQQVKTLRYEVDDQYIPALGLELVAGRNFSSLYGSDSTAIILNETAATAFGWGKEALGQTLTTSTNDGRKHHFRVIGVVGDFHFKSLHERISPLVMVLGKNNGSVIAKVKTDRVGELIAAVRQKWEALAPAEPFEYSFLDDRFNQTYASEQKAGQILGIFAGLTIFVACLGLFGLATFTAEQRTREIGIRKVLGADVASIVTLLSKDFLKLVLLAAVIAFPIAWLAMQQWLEDFAYRIDLSLWVFIVAGIVAAVVAFLTISYQAVKAATSNPIHNLRNE